MTFKCEGESFEQIPDDIFNKTGLSFPQAHSNKEDMAILAKEMKQFKDDVICSVPFCVTVEAEALGGNINLGDNKVGPRVNQYAFSSMEELRDIEEIDFTKGRIKEVLDCVEVLNGQKEFVSLNVEGPFTIISSLIDPIHFYKAIRKDRELVNRVMQIIENSIVKYIEAGIKKGAKIISYADPVGALDIVGPKVYKEISGKISRNILSRVHAQLGDSIIHLCGKTSTAFEKIGFSTACKINVDENLTYGQAIYQLLEEKPDIKIIGHRCIKKTPLKMGNPVIWEIKISG